MLNLNKTNLLPPYKFDADVDVKSHDKAKTNKRARSSTKIVPLLVAHKKCMGLKADGTTKSNASSASINGEAWWSDSSELPPRKRAFLRDAQIRDRSI